jgi:hypothetical protein
MYAHAFAACVLGNREGSDERPQVMRIFSRVKNGLIDFFLIEEYFAAVASTKVEERKKERKRIDGNARQH